MIIIIYLKYEIIVKPADWLSIIYNIEFIHLMII